MSDKVSLPILAGGKFTGRALTHINALADSKVSELETKAFEAIDRKADQATFDTFLNTVTNQLSDSEARTALAGVQAVVGAERTAREEADTRLAGRVTALEEAEPDLSGYATKEDLEGFDPLPDGGSIGQILSKSGQNSLEWVNIPGESIKSVTAIGKNTIRVTLSNGIVSDIPVEATLSWSKDEQAKVQGYWEVVSDTEPTQTTYTTKDGVTVPVKWTKPLSTIVPVFPELPSWDDYEQKVLVPDLVGVTYQVVGGDVIPPNVWTRLPGQVPFDVTVEAIAKPGYKLLAAPSWKHSFPNPAQRSVLLSDTFDRADAPYSALGSTDSALGGVAYNWVLFHDVRPPESIEKLVRISNKQLVFEPYSAAGVATTGWCGLKLNGVSENWQLSFDLKDYSNVPPHKQGISFSVTGYGAEKSGVGISLYMNGSTKVVRASWRDVEANKNITVDVLPGTPTGGYVIEKYRNTLRVKHSEGERSISLSGHNPTATATPELLIQRGSNQAWDRDTQRVALDNLVFTKLGF